MTFAALRRRAADGHAQAADETLNASNTTTSTTEPVQIDKNSTAIPNQLPPESVDAEIAQLEHLVEAFKSSCKRWRFPSWPRDYNPKPTDYVEQFSPFRVRVEAIEKLVKELESPDVMKSDEQKDRIWRAIRNLDEPSTRFLYDISGGKSLNRLFPHESRTFGVKLSPRSDIEEFLRGKKPFTGIDPGRPILDDPVDQP